MIFLSEPLIKGNEWKYIKDCLDTNWVSSAGSYVDKFEEGFAGYMGTSAAVVTMNGTAALELALRVLKIGAGDEVIVPSMTFISPVNTIKYVGAEPVFADCERDTFVMDADRIEELISPKTKAIMPVHIYGHPVDMDKVMETARKHSLFVIEDSTESLGSFYKGKPTGTIGDIGCFSFNGNKMITTGAGGMLISDNTKYTKYAKYLSAQTKSFKDGIFYHEEIGYNYRMPNVLAAMGCAQLEKLDEYIAARRKNAALYNKLLSDRRGITLPIEKEGCINCQWLYSVLLEDDYDKTSEELRLLFKEKGVETRPFFYPVHLMPPYEAVRTGDMSVTLDIAERGINLPSSAGLKEEDIEYICSII